LSVAIIIASIYFFLLLQGKQITEGEDPTTATKALVPATIFLIVGIVAGLGIVTLIIIDLKKLNYS
jgi:multisubunit Na+/H+ antiporter MnhB subunit